MKIIDVPEGEGREERVLSMDRFSGDWRVMSWLAADGKGDYVEAFALENVTKLRIEFQANGPATKHRGAL